MKLWPVFFAFLLISLTACPSKPDATDSHNNPIYLSDYRGKWVIINYWATWCPPCLKELPELDALSKQQKEKLIVLGVNFDGLPNAELQRFADKLHLTFPLLSNFPSQKLGIEDIPSLPLTLIVDPQGKLSKTLYGPQTQKSLLDLTR